MGVVYAARDLSLDRQVALKCLFPDRTTGEHIRRFKREARVAGAIDHPNVVRVRDAGEHAGGVFIVMELLEGESLRARLRRGTFGVTKAVDLLLPALWGIDAAHRLGIVHRDLKPENLMLCPSADGGLPEIKVLDFGLSKLVEPPLDSLRTQPGTLLGTPYYMAPEQAAGMNEIDARTDLYTLAVILYEMIAGRRPIESLTLAGLLVKLQRSEPTPLRALVPDVDPAFANAVMRALSPDRAQRPETVAAFARALEPFGTRRPRPTKPAPAASQRGRRAAPLAALGALLLLLLAAAAWLFSAPAPQGKPIAAPSAIRPNVAPKRAAAAPTTPPVESAAAAEPGSSPSVEAVETPPQRPAHAAPAAPRALVKPRARPDSRPGPNAKRDSAPRRRPGAPLGTLDPWE
jgi:serine/threonine-protein kinase